MSKAYYVRACWDEEAGIYYSKSNVPGLVIEAESLPEFVAIAEQLVPELLHDNAINPAFVNAPGTKSVRPRVALKYACA
jgi:hypothetical protein